MGRRTLDCGYFFFFNDTAPTEIYTLSLHDALPIWATADHVPSGSATRRARSSSSTSSARCSRASGSTAAARSEEHTSELQSRQYLVCRLLLEKNTNILLIP